MKRQLQSLIRTIVLCSLLAVQTVPVFAQEDLHPAPSETIHLKVGDIFEILPIHDVPDPTYTWILTQDRTFLEANRAPSFRKRLIQPGMYTLYAEIASADGSRRISRTISLDYSARQPGESTATTTTTNDTILVRTEPAADEQGRIALAAGTQLVELLPVNPDVVPLALDLDLAKDADGDGKPDNDIQADDTFFHSDATPLFLWITNDPLTTHSVSVTAAAADGAKTQKLDILNAEIAKAQGLVKSPVRIETESTGERSYVYNAVFENPDAAAGQLLYQWQFGDGQQSLVTKPSHTYAEDGTYEVSLLIRNLRDGSEVASTSLALNVTPTISENPSSEASSEASEPTTPAQNSGIGIGSIFLGVTLFILSLLLGIGIIFLFGKLRKNKTSLADKLENIEKTMVKSPAQEVPNLTIAPPVVVQESNIQEPPASIAEREKELAVEPPAPQPVAKKEDAPAWLTATTPKSAESSVATPVAQVTPQPTPPAVTPVTKPTPAPAAQTPSWLQTPTAPSPAAMPKPAPAVTEQKQVSPSAPAAPAWLQPTRASSDGQPTSPVATPTPQAPKTTSVPTPKPVTSPAPVVPPTPKPQPQAPMAPTVTPAAAPTPTPQVQAPVTPSMPQQKPRPAVTPVVPFNPATLPTPKPVQPPTPPVAPAPVVAPQAPKVLQPAAPSQPAPTTNPSRPVQMDIPPSGDQPIAIIRAESLNPPEGPASA